MSRLLLSGLLAWLVSISATPVYADEAEDRAVDFLVKQGGSVGRDEKLPDKPVVSVWVSGKLRDGGVSALAKLKSLVSVHLYNTNVTDSGLKEIALLKNLTSFGIVSKDKVSDAGIKEIAKLQNLTSLTIGTKKMTDVGFKEIPKLSNLTTLNLLEVKFTETGAKEIAKLPNLTTLMLAGIEAAPDTGLKEIAGLKNLTTLSLTGTQITDAGLKELAPLQKLTALNLKKTKVTEAGLKELAPLKNLTTLTLPEKVTDTSLAILREANLLHALPQAWAANGKRATKLDDITVLYLSSEKKTDPLVGFVRQFEDVVMALDVKDYVSETTITNAGLKEVAKLTNLTVLGLSFTDVTDEGLKELAALKNLTTLFLRHTQVTEAGVKKLRQALPNCRIITTN